MTEGGPPPAVRRGREDRRDERILRARTMRWTHNPIASWATAEAVLPLASPPVLSLIGSCYGPVILPVILLSPRMRVVSETAHNKDYFRDRLASNRVISRFFSLLLG
jgi:hypothetical protein